MKKNNSIKEKPQNTFNSKITWLFYGVSVVTIVTIAVIAFGMGVKIRTDSDISTWVALVVGTAISVFIAFSIVLYSNDQRKTQSEDKEKRGKTFTLSLLNYIIPLRKEVTDLIDYFQGEFEANFRAIPELKKNELKIKYDNIREYRNRIQPIIFMSGDSIDAKNQLMLNDIVDMLEYEHSIEIYENLLVVLYQIRTTLTRYLLLNKSMVQSSINEKNIGSRKKLDEFKQKTELSHMDQLMKKFYERRIKSNEEFVKDILEKED